MFVTTAGGDDPPAGGDGIIDPLSQSQPLGQDEKGKQGPEKGQPCPHLDDPVDPFLEGVAVPGAVQPFFQLFRVEFVSVGNTRFSKRDEMEEAEPVQLFCRRHTAGAEGAPSVVKDGHLLPSEE